MYFIFNFIIIKKIFESKESVNNMTKSERFAQIGRMYLEEKLTAPQIADETGLSVNTVKQYLSKGGFKKSTYLTSKELGEETVTQQPEVKPKRRKKKVVNQFEPIDEYGTYINLTNGQIYRKLKTDEIRQLFLAGIKK